MAGAATSGRRRGSALGQGPLLFSSISQRQRERGRDGDGRTRRNGGGALTALCEGFPAAAPPSDPTGPHAMLTRIFKRAEIRFLGRSDAFGRTAGTPVPGRPGHTLGLAQLTSALRTALRSGIQREYATGRSTAAAIPVPPFYPYP